MAVCLYGEEGDQKMRQIQVVVSLEYCVLYTHLDQGHSFVVFLTVSLP